jgi:hypothetical protein
VDVADPPPIKVKNWNNCANIVVKKRNGMTASYIEQYLEEVLDRTRSFVCTRRSLEGEALRETSVMSFTLTSADCWNALNWTIP